MKNFLAQRRKGAKRPRGAAGMSENPSHSNLRNHWMDQAALPQAVHLCAFAPLREIAPSYDLSIAA